MVAFNLLHGQTLQVKVVAVHLLRGQAPQVKVAASYTAWPDSTGKGQACGGSGDDDDHFVFLVMVDVNRSCCTGKGLELV